VSILHASNQQQAIEVNRAGSLIVKQGLPENQKAVGENVDKIGFFVENCL